MPTVRVKLFAAPREVVGLRDLPVEVPPGATVEGLLAMLVERYPPLARWQGTLVVSVNRRVVPPTTSLGDGDEVALLPPVSGGSGATPLPGRLHEGPISVDALLAEVSKEGAGAAVAFLGLVREGPSKWVRGESVERLEFEAYEAMAGEELARLSTEARGRFGLVDARILHRAGTLTPGESIVLVLVTSAHRQAAFEAAAWIMDRMKTVVPIWKKEEFASGGHHWVEEGVERRG